MISSKNMPPAWKVKRELARPFRRLGQSIRFEFVEPITQAIYDRNAERLISRLQGSVSIGHQIAVFVVFQPKGITASVHHTLQHLLDNNWSPIVVSNGRLTATDKMALADHASLVIERPNIGYDFGGYRDGLFVVQALESNPERVLLMNDSTWFPLRQDDTTLQKLAAFNADFAGQVYKHESSQDPQRNHMESHLLMIGKDWLNSDVFIEFWTNYRLTSSRDATIESGEKGISRLADRFAHVEALVNRDKFMHIIERLSNEEISDVSRNMATDFGDPSHRSFEPMLRLEDVGRSEYENWIRHKLSDAQYHFLSGTFIYPAVKYAGLGFLKKTSDFRFQGARVKLLELLEDGKIDPIEPIVEKEIRRCVESWIYRR